MISKSELARAMAVVFCVTALLLAGCQSTKQHYVAAPPAPLGCLSDSIWQSQEAAAEASDFVVHQNEFERDTEWLNTAGEDHVKSIAARLAAGDDAMVVVERSMLSARDDTEHGYPVHPNPELDMRRREIIVRSLASMRVDDAQDRVMVAPAIAQGFTGSEASATYARGLGASDAGPGMGGGFGGFMFSGGY